MQEVLPDFYFNTFQSRFLTKSQLGIFLLIAFFSLQTHAQVYDYDRIFKTGNTRQDDGRKTKKSLPSDYPTFLMVKVGAAVPFGSYASVNPQNLNASFANIGVDLNANAAFSLYEFLYSYSTFGFVKSPARMGELTELYRTSFAANGLELREFDYNGYNHLYLLTGVMLTGRINKIAVDVRAQAGASFGADTEQSARVADGTIQYLVRSERATAVSFMPSAGISVRFNPKAGIYASINADYRHANYRYQAVGTFINNVFIGSNDYTVRMQIVTIGGGVGFKF